MKKIMAVLVISFLAGQAYASPTILSHKKDQNFGIFTAKDSLYCSHRDMSADGVADTAVVTLYVSKIINNEVGLLQNSYIINEFPDADGEMCRKVQAIIDGSHMSFGAFYGTYDSLLMMMPGELIERLTVKIGGKAPFGEPGAEDLSIELTKVITKELTL